MSKEVKRYCLGEFAEPHTFPIGPGAHVLASDYEALLAERDRMRAEVEALSHQLRTAHGFIESTEAFGRAAASGVLECGDVIWNIDDSKALIAALQGEQP